MTVDKVPLPDQLVEPEPQIHKAILNRNGSVKKGEFITQAQAITERQNGNEVVVCGPILRKNRDLAQIIEKSANGTWKRCPPHANAGWNALPHYQPDPRPPSGHTFYETDNRKAV